MVNGLIGARGDFFGEEKDMDEEDRAELVAKVREAIAPLSWNPDNPALYAMAEAAVDALADDIGHGFDPISGATI